MQSVFTQFPVLTDHSLSAQPGRVGRGRGDREQTPLAKTSTQHLAGGGLNHTSDDHGVWQIYRAANAGHANERAGTVDQGPVKTFTQRNKIETANQFAERCEEAIADELVRRALPLIYVLSATHAARTFSRLQKQQGAAASVADGRQWAVAHRADQA